MAVATDLDYCSLQRIREESGHQHLNKLQSLTGTTDGVNDTFYVDRTYIVDRNYNDVIDVGAVDGDVIVYDDDVAVEVSSVNQATGEIVLASAPASSSVMIVTYAHSVLSDSAVDQYREEAIDFVQRKISGIIPYTGWTSSDVPAIVRSIVRIYAAGLILIADQGLNTDTEDSSKDGYKRLSVAKSMLQDYLDEVSDASGSTTRVSASSRSDGNIFYRNTDLTTYNESVSSTDAFMRKE